MTAKIIVVDDDPEFPLYLRAVLAHSDCQITAVGSALNAVSAVINADPDLVILDIMMPHINGWQICKRLRTISDVSVLICTVLTGSTNVAKGLQLGADDYVSKLCHVEELQARVEALLRRAKPASVQQAPRLVDVGNGLSLDLERRAAVVRRQVVELTPIEFQLLACLAQRQGQATSYNELWQEVWGYDDLPDKRVIHKALSRLREKIGKDKLVCVRGWGYLLQ
jgi:two-component system response regulator MprA